MIEWQHDYEREVRAITGQAEPVPLFVMQMQGFTNRVFSSITADQFNAHLRAPGKVILVAPGYFLTFRPDGLHYTSASQLRMGEYFGKAYAQTIFTGRPWQPLHPSSVSVAGNVVTVRFLVPVPPLVLDTVAVTNPGNYGFEYLDDSGTNHVQSVQLDGDSVHLTLSRAPDAGNRRVRYAVAAPAEPAGAFSPGPQRGVRGNLRDSDATPSRYGSGPLHNWCVGFQLAVP